MYLKEIHQQYIADHPRGVRPNTAKYLYACVQCFSAYLKQPANVTDLSRATVNQYVDWMLVHRAPSTTRSQRCGLLVLWRFAADNGYVDPPARVRCPKRVAKPVSAWTKAEVERLRDYALTLPGKLKNGQPKGLYFAALVCCAYETGLRLSDQLALKRESIQPLGDGFGLTVVEQKTGKIARRIITAETVGMIDDLLRQSPKNALIWPLWARREQFFASFRRLVKGSGINPGTFKHLRRAAATNVEMQERGGGQRFLNHSSPQVTAESYLDPSQIEPSILRVIPLVVPSAFAQDILAAYLANPGKRDAPAAIPLPQQKQA